MQAVGDLDDHHPHVFRHRQEHLAQRLRVRGGESASTRLRNLLDLGGALDEARDIRAETPAQLRCGHVAVLDHVMQQRRLHRLRVHAQLGDEAGDRDRVSDVGVAGAALLSFVRVDGER